MTVELLLTLVHIDQCLETCDSREDGLGEDIKSPKAKSFELPPPPAGQTWAGGLGMVNIPAEVLKKVGWHREDQKRQQTGSQRFNGNYLLRYPEVLVHNQ